MMSSGDGVMEVTLRSNMTDASAIQWRERHSATYLSIGSCMATVATRSMAPKLPTAVITTFIFQACTIRPITHCAILPKSTTGFAQTFSEKSSEPVYVAKEALLTIFCQTQLVSRHCHVLRATRYPVCCL